MRHVGRVFLALILLCDLGQVAGPTRAGSLGVSGGVVNQGGGARIGATLSLSNDALGDTVSGSMTSASGRFRLEPYSSSFRPVTPTAEVQGLRLDGPPDDTAVTWNPDPEADAYNLFRAESPGPGNPPPPIFDAYICSTPDPQFQEWQGPPPGQYYAYLVTAVNTYYESDLGTGSGGIPRTLGTPCP